MNPNGVKVTGERLTQNSRPGFSLATAKPSRARSRAWTDYPSTIYTSQNHKNHAGFSNSYILEQKGLLSEEIQEDSTSFDIFRQWAQITPLRYIRSRITNITQGEQKGLSNFPNCDGQLNFSAPDCKKYFLQSEHIRDVRKKFILSTLINLRIRQLVKKFN